MAQTYEDRGFGKEFKIPKKRTHAESIQQQQHATIGGQTTEMSPLANSEYNYRPPVQTYMAPHRSYSTFYPGGSGNPSGMSDSHLSEFITEKIYKTLDEYKEKPKKYDPGYIRKQTIPDLEDQSLPKDLTAMFQPLFCKLCEMQLTSNTMAKLHYKSKNHEKKIRKYLIEYSERTGEPLHKRAKVASTPKEKSEEEKNPIWFHCEVCDLPLTGKMHAESHYMGRNHQKALLGHKTPAGRGFYNDDGKWVRTKAPTKLTLKDGEDGFGLDFRKDSTATETAAVVPTSSVPEVSSSQKIFSCSICNVVCPCNEQLEMHLKGNKHRKKLKNLGLENSFEIVDETVKDILPKDIPQTAHKFSPNRTPSGLYYCKPCNLTLNSELQFKQHIQSKNHNKKVAQV